MGVPLISLDTWVASLVPTPTSAPDCCKGLRRWLTTKSTVLSSLDSRPLSVEKDVVGGLGSRLSSEFNQYL